MSSTGQDWFMMTGDLIINLRSTKTGDALAKIKQQQNRKPILDSNQNQVKSQVKNNFEPKLKDESKDEPASEPVINKSEASENQSSPNHEANSTSSQKSTSSSGNSSGIAEEDLSNSQIFSDNLSLTSPSKHSGTTDYSTPNKQYSSEDLYFYENYDVKHNTNYYENIRDCHYLSKSQESNLYNLIDDTKSFDNLSLDSDNGSLVCYNFSSMKNQGIDAPSASRLAKRLYNLEGFQKSDIARHLSKNNEFSRAVAEEYLHLFDFTGMTLDEALRCFLSRFHLIGETQDRERVLVFFSKRFLECNPNTNIKSDDALHTLVCALMILNTDLHEVNIQRKMTCSDFIINLEGLNDGEDYPSELLKSLYYSIKNDPLGWNQDEILDGKKGNGNVFSKITTISKSISSPYATLPRNKSNSCCSNPFVEMPNPSFAIEYKKGYIRRKCCYSTNGKRALFGKRRWKMFYATLRDLVLYLHKDENGFCKSQLQENFANSIRIHHSIASIANDYPKKKFVFRLITADYAEYLFETSDSRELQSWVDTINTIAASLSAPALPMAVSSDNYKFKRELFPVSHTKLSLRDQLKDQENRLLSLQKELELLLEKTGKNSLNRTNQRGLAEKEAYLQHEVKRYRIYISCLKWKLQNNEQSMTDYQSIECQKSTTTTTIPDHSESRDSFNQL